MLMLILVRIFLTKGYICAGEDSDNSGRASPDRAAAPRPCHKAGGSPDQV